MSTQLALDTFVRANQSGFGTASDGTDTWTARDATATYSIVSNQGKVLQNSTNADELNTFFSPPSNTAYEIYGQCVTSNATSHPGLVVNFQSAGNFVKCEISPTAVNVVRYVSNSQTTLKSDTGTKVTASNATYNFRFRWEVGGAYYFKVWIGTVAEPAAWNCNGVVDTTYNSGAVGVYLAARGATTDTCLWNQFYVSYSELNEDTTANGLSLGDGASTFTLVDTPAADTLSAPSETAAYVVNPSPTDSTTNAESVTFALSETIAADALTQTDASTATLIQNQTDALAAPSDTQAWAESFAPADSNSNTESVTFALAETIAADSVGTSDSMSPSIKPSVTDTLSETEASSFTLAESLAESALNEAETALLALAETLPADALTTSEIKSYAVSEAFPSDGVTSSESNATAEYYSVEEDMVSAESTLEILVDTPATDSVTLAETKSISSALTFPVTPLTETEIKLTVVTQTDTTTLGTTSDSIVFGQPGVLFPDQLTITDSIDISQGPPLVDVALIPSDSLDWDTNFTDHCQITESLQIAYTSSLLDARSVLYSNTISDQPSAYYQLNEDTFGGLFQRDGSDQPNNASIPILYGATLEYTWAQIEPEEGNRLFSTIDADILPWKNQQKKVILRVVVASTPFYNNTHNANTAGQATPSWVFTAGAPSVTGLDGAVYPVYWNATFLQKYQNFITAFANYYDENSTVAGIVISCGVNGTTSLEASGDTTSNTVALWTPVGYTPAQWVAGTLAIIKSYQTAFQHTPLILSVNDGVIAPDTVYNIHQFISLAVAQGVWLMDENVYINEQHNDPNWNIVPLVTVPKTSIASGNTPDTLDGELTLMINYQADYAAVWAADVTLDNEPTLTKYFDLAQSKGLNDSATSNFKMSIYGGVYPTSHISTGDYLNGAQQFDGLTGYGYIGSLAQTTTSAWTLKCTVFPTILPMDEGIAFSVGNDGSSGYGGYAIGISNGAAGGVGAKFCAHLPGIGWLDSGYSFPEVGQWYSLFVTWDGFTLRFYANGVQTPNTYSTTAYPPSLAMTIGAQWDGMTRTAKRFFIGSVDECAVYPFALDPSRVLILSEIEQGQNELLSGSGSALSVSEQLSVSDASSTTNDTVLASDALTLVETFTYSVANSNVAGYTTLASDQFNRLTSGFGTATDGQTWQIKAGSSTLAVDGAIGTITGSTTTNILLLGATNTLEDVSCMVNLSATGDTIGVIAFGSDASNFYALRYTSTLQLYKTVAGVETALGSAAAFTLSASTWYHLHLKVSEGVLYGNIWADGSAEPVSWMVTAADTALSSGAAGLYVHSTASGHVVSVDNFFAVDNLLADYLFLRESYTFTAILPPLVDATAAPIEVLNATNTVGYLEVYLTNIIPRAFGGTIIAAQDDALIPEEDGSLTPNAHEVGFLNFGASAQAWIVGLVPVEQLTESESIATPVVVDIPADVAPPTSDSLTPFITPVPVDLLAESETLAQNYSASLVDTPTLVDASTTTQIRIIVDNDPSTYYVTRVFGGTIVETFTTPLIASDSITPTDIPQEVSQLTTADSVAHGPAYIFTETLTFTETLKATIVETIPVDATAAPTDTLTPNVTPVPVDQLNTAESIIFAVGPILPADVTGSIIEEDLLATVLQVAEDDGVTTDLVTPTVLQVVTDTCNIANSQFDTFIESNIDNLVISDTIFVAVTEHVASDLVTTSDVVTPTDRPMLQDTVTPSDTLSQVVTSLPLADTPIETESILSIEVASNTLVTLSNTEVVTYTVLPQESNILTETESNNELVATSLVEGVTQQEVTLTNVLQAASDSVDIEEQTIATNGVFDPTELSVESESILEQEYVYNTDSTVSSDSVIAIETFIHFLPDQPTEASDSVSFTSIFVPVDTEIEVESENVAFAVSLAADTAPVSELISVLQANSFTGWVDILGTTSSVVYAVNGLDETDFTLVESFTFTQSALYQDASTPQSESASLVVEQTSTDSNTQREVTSVSVTLPITEQLTQLETTTTQVVALESTTLQVTESLVAVTANSVVETLLQVDASTVTSNTNEVVTLSLTESNMVTSGMLQVEVTPADEVVTTQCVVTWAVTPLLQTDVTTFVAVATPIDVTGNSETLAVTCNTLDVTPLFLLDVTTTTSVTTESNTLLQQEGATYVTGLLPVTLTTTREVVLVTDEVTGQDVTDESESLAPGYTLLDTPLVLTETITATQQTYIKTFGVVRTGQADGIIRTGQVTGTTRTGLVDGVIR